jgi:hypothetical protein
MFAVIHARTALTPMLTSVALASVIHTNADVRHTDLCVAHQVRNTIRADGR